jgi:hypothetical protein
VRGVAIGGLAAGGQDVYGLTVAGAYLSIPENGIVRGVAASAFTHVKGEQRGLSIGLLNYARRLEGVQLGILNYAGNRPAALRWLPVMNWSFE